MTTELDRKFWYRGGFVAGLLLGIIGGMLLTAFLIGI